MMNASFRSISLAFAILPFAISMTSKATPCGLADATNDCEAFRQDPGLIRFDDGTRISAEPDPFLTSSDREEFSRRDVYGRTAAEILRQVPEARLHPRARTWISSTAAAETLLKFRGWRSKDYGAMTMAIPWPLESPAPGLTEVPVREAMLALESSLGRPTLDSLDAAVGEHQVLITDRGARARQRYLATIDQDAIQHGERMDRLAERSIALARRRILRGRSESALSAEERNLLARASLVRFRRDAGQSCSSGGVGAFYNAQSHSFAVCPASFALPDESLVMMMAHEVAHSFDPCLARGPLVQVDPQRLRQWRNSREPDALTTSDRSFLDGLANSAGYAVIEPVRMTSPVVRSLLSAGILRVHEPGMTQASHPYSSVISCLATTQGGGFAAPTWNPAEADANPECQGHAINEAFCDWFGAEALASGPESLRRYDPPDRLRRVVGGFASVACLHRPGQRPTDDEQALTQSHPAMTTRTNMIVLRNERLRQAIGCQGASTVPSCRETPSATTARPAASPAPETQGRTGPATTPRAGAR